eukprot:395950_1
MAQAKHAFTSTVKVNFDAMGDEVTKLKCANCYKNFENSGKAVKALDKYWHIGCLKCVSCKLAISGKYQKKGNGAECAECVMGTDDIFDNFEEFLGEEEVNRNVIGQKFACIIQTRLIKSIVSRSILLLCNGRGTTHVSTNDDGIFCVHDDMLTL